VLGGSLGRLNSNLRKNSLRILIVDDHEAIRKGVCAILSARLDIEVCGEAANGKEAIAKTKELQPDLIILDVTMPVLSGFDDAREQTALRRSKKDWCEGVCNQDASRRNPIAGGGCSVE
jgi:CheY-like chemotaxis protein